MVMHHALGSFRPLDSIYYLFAHKSQKTLFSPPASSDVRWARTIGTLWGSQLPSGLRRVAACVTDLHHENTPLASCLAESARQATKSPEAHMLSAVCAQG